jgi:hypothetical protein
MNSDPRECLHAIANDIECGIEFQYKRRTAQKVRLAAIEIDSLRIKVKDIK